MSNDHFVPECYMKGFVNPDGTFFCWTTKYKSISQKYPAQVCYKKDFYRIDQEFMKTHKISDPAAIEHYAFKEFEDQIQNIVARLSAKTRIMPFYMLVTLCRGYILQKIRTPFYQKGVTDLEKK